MVLRFPESTSECIYFTNRQIEEKGKAIAWVYKKTCPQCKKAKMGKPVEKGKVKIRATEYVCPSCGYTEQKLPHEESLMVEVQYICPYCGKSGEATTQYIRKAWNGIKSYVFECESCKKKIGITKKMKKAKGKVEDAVDDE